MDDIIIRISSLPENCPVKDDFHYKYGFNFDTKPHLKPPITKIFEIVDKKFKDFFEMNEIKSVELYETAFRFIQKSNLCLCQCSFYRLFVTAFMLAFKKDCDFYPTNDFISKSFGLSQKLLLRMELNILVDIDFQLYN